MKKLVIITRCSNERMWYKDKIGEIYEVKFIDDNGDVVVDLANSLGQLGSIMNTDVKFIEEGNNEGEQSQN